MSMKNSSDTIWNRTSDLPICSAVPEPLCHHQRSTITKKDMDEEIKRKETVVK
jgi:hypothetical protein